MNKRKISAIFVSFTCLLVFAFTNEVKKIHVKREAFPEKNLAIESFYRGTNRVLTIRKNKRGTFHSFIINGKTVAVEGDEDGDGFFEHIMIFDPDTGDFDEYIRSTNGLVAPIDSSALNELRAKKTTADKTLDRLMDQMDQ